MAQDKIRKFIPRDLFVAAQNANRQSGLLARQREVYSEDEVSSHDFTSFNTKDAVVWIDPLDGTSDFVKGTLTAVTVLIGLSIK